MNCKVKCPTCSNEVEMTRENLCRPFCSEKCRLIDLGDWLEERHSIPVDNAEEIYNIRLADDQAKH